MSVAAMGREGAAVAAMLTEARVPGDGVLFVHCAFRRLAAAGFSVDGVIEALLAHMARGTLVMPAMSWRIVTPTNPIFDELATPSHVGVLAETFRTRFATHRSLHPTHSASMSGTGAVQLSRDHHLDDTPCSPNSPYGQAARMDAHVVMIGVGFERCTAIHHAEEMIAPDIYLKAPFEAELYQCRDRAGGVHAVRLRRHVKLNRDFPQFEGKLAERGRLRRGRLANVSWLGTSLADLLGEVSATLHRDPRAIIAPPGAPIIP